MCGRVAEVFRVPYNTPTVELAGKVLPLSEVARAASTYTLLLKNWSEISSAHALVEFQAAVLEVHGTGRDPPPLPSSSIYRPPPCTVTLPWIVSVAPFST